jgi:hypothetical protein
MFYTKISSERTRQEKVWHLVLGSNLCEFLQDSWKLKNKSTNSLAIVQTLIKDRGKTMGGYTRQITGQQAAKKAEAAAAEQQKQMEKERAAAQAEAEELAQEQSRKFRGKQRRGIRSLVETSEYGDLG